MNKFKNGDLVKVLDPYQGYASGWVDNMDKSINKIFSIVSIGNSCKFYTLSTDDSFYYPETHLELVIPEFDIGDSVVVLNPNGMNTKDLKYGWVDQMYDSIGMWLTVKKIITGENILYYKLSNGFLYTAGVLSLISKNSENEPEPKPVDTEKDIEIAFPCK